MRVTDRPDGVTILDDSYNANPESMAAGLRTLATVAGGRRRTVAVLGQMNELGEGSAAAHRAAGRLAARLGIDVVVAVGNNDAALLAAAAGGASGTDNAGVGRPLVEHVVDRESAARGLRGLLQPGDVVLVKGSNGVGLSRLADKLLEAQISEMSYR
jgi:UDP-N-acetylmuramoyl-tripeptide--D-alanyl-D-alanine ligase